MTPRTTGFLLLLFTACGWGFAWPAMKFLVGEMPPLAMRAWPAMVGASVLAMIALAAGEKLAITRAIFPRLALAAFLNVACWMGFSTFALLWLSASEAAITCYTMPIWTAILAWPVLGERPTARRVIALLIGFTGVAVLMLGQGVSIGMAKLPGVALTTGAAITFAIGTVVTKRWPLELPPITSAAWQVGLGGAPMLLASLLFERLDPSLISGTAWALLAYSAVIPLCLCYAGWFAALRRLPASAASIGTLLAPVIGVCVAAIALGEPFGVREVVALSLTLGGVVLAVRG
jgi:drug/metabolite transporter (DMT)-like permease